MSSFVSCPNLPKNASKLLLGERYLHILQNPLTELGLDVISVPDNIFVDRRLRGHADLSVCHTGDSHIFLANHLKESSFSAELKGLGFDIRYIDEVQSADYPNDCQLNVCIVGPHAVFNKSAASGRIIEFISARGIKSIEVKQGYSKCSICIVDDCSVITSDIAAAKTLRELGLNVLLIRPGHIDLEGFQYGFIGGGSFKLSEKIMAFTGRLDLHPDKKDILSFLESRGIESVFLTDSNIFDVGSIIPICEK